FLGLFVILYVGVGYPERPDPFVKAVEPFLMDRRSVFGPAKILDLHLLEFAGTKDEVSRRDLISERLADLSDTERKFAARRVEDVYEIREDTLRRLGPEICE